MSDVYKRLTIEEFCTLTFTLTSEDTPFPDGRRYKCEDDPRLDIYASKGNNCDPCWMSFVDPSVSIIPTKKHMQEKKVFMDDHGVYSVNLDSIQELWLPKISSAR
tara:strand:- start:177 stop:491 length:315 start_codon:yes stop_codon:yes gene_type:complete